ncbi:MAG: hypothetical protein R3F35_17525 [Myxococcota bacterium]
MLASSSTRAGQVDLSVENRLGFDSNVFRSTNETEDGTHEISPMLTVRDARDPLEYRFEYRPTYRTFMRTSGIDGADHVARGSIDWDVTPVDVIRLSGSHYNGRQFLTEAADLGTTTVYQVNDRERLRRSDANAYYGRVLTPTLRLGLEFDFDDFDASGTSARSLTDSRAYTGSVSIMKSLSQRLEIGLIGSGRWRENRAVEPDQVSVPTSPRASSRTNVWDVLGSIRYQITPTIDAAIQAGPSFIRSEQFPNGVRGLLHDESSSINVFAVGSLSKRWQNGDADASYVRSEARSGNVASSSSISDVLSLDVDQRLTERWRVGASVSWNRLEQITSQQGLSGRFRIEAIRSAFKLDFAWTSRVFLLAQYRYTRQDTKNSTFGSNRSAEVDLHLAFIGLRYTFDPILY